METSFARRADDGRFIGLVGAGIVLLIAVFTAVILHENDKVAQASAEAQVVRMTKTVAYQLTSRLTTLDRAMRYAGAEITEAGSAERFTRLGADGQLPTQLLSEFVFIATDGRVVASAMGDAVLARGLDLSDREYFRLQIGGTVDGTDVGRPVAGRETGRLLLPVSRLVRDAGGAPMGVLAAFIDVNALGRIWTDIGLSAQDSVELIGGDGKVWIRWPDSAAAAGAGATSGASLDRIVWSQRLADWPLTIAGGLDRKALLLGNARAQLVVVTAALLGCGLVVWFSLALAKRTRQLVEQRGAARHERDAATAMRMHLLAALDAVPVEFLEFDSNSRLVLTNRAARASSPWLDFDAFMGKTRAALLTATAAHFRPTDPARDWAAWVDFQVGIFERGGVFEAQRANGDWWQTSVGVQPDGSRILIRTDITELKRRMERLDSVFQSTGAAIVMLDRAGRVVLANQAVLDLQDMTTLEIVGMCYDDLRFTGFDAAIFESWRAVTDKTRQQPVEFECSLAAATGGRQVYRFTANPIQDKGGQLRYVVLIGVDDTERRRAEVRLFDASRLANLGEMASGIAHEINQPLAVIRLAAEALHEELEMPESAALAGELGDYIKQKLSRIAAQTERAAGIIRDLRTVAYRPTNKAQPFDLSEAVRVGGDLLREQLKLARIDVVLDLPVPGPLVLGEASRVQQIVINLLLNARDAILSRDDAPASGARGRISLSVVAGPPRGGTVLTIEDDGPGISATALPRLFEPFFTTKPVDKGTGLGLSISYDIVNRMGGEITAENRAQGGARFRIVLPPLSGSAFVTSS